MLTAVSNDGPDATIATIVFEQYMETIVASGLGLLALTGLIRNVVLRDSRQTWDAFEIFHLLQFMFCVCRVVNSTTNFSKFVSVDLNVDRFLTWVQFLFGRNVHRLVIL